MDSTSAMTPAAARPVTAEGDQAWLTTILRPAGSLDGTAVRQLGAALGHLAAASDMIVVDLAAVGVRDPRALARALREPAGEMQRAGRCLLVIGAAPGLTAEFDRAAVPVVALAADAIPGPAAAE